MNKDRKSTVKKNVFLVIILALLVALIGGTYAKYSSTFNGTGNLNVAKWSVKVNGNTSKSFDLTLAPEKNGNIVENKIAPGYSASGEIEIDLTETEVAVDLSATLGELTGALASKDNVKLTSEITPQESAVEGTGSLSDKYTIALPTGKAFTATNGKYKIKVTATWEDKSIEKDADDTNAGETAGTSSVTVNVKLEQHIQASEAA